MLDRIVDSGLVPEPMLRAGIRAICALRLRQERGTVEEEQARHQRLVAELRSSEAPLTTAPATAQHFEVPPALFELVLGPALAYASCYWPTGVEALAEAETAMLELTAERAGLAPGQDVLDLGCNWGALSLWAAARYPTSQITAVASSPTQRAFIEARARARGLTNVTAIAADVATIALPTASFDRVVSIETFEQLRNYERMLHRIAGWLRPGHASALFIQVFAHRQYAYRFEDAGGTDWMAREFFSGGIMPSANLLHFFQTDLRLADEWHLAGTHYARTAEAWYANLMARRGEVERVLAQAYGGEAARRFQRWRVFFLACAELFGYRYGREWIVAHYRFTPR